MNQEGEARDAGLRNPGFWEGKRVLVTGHTGFKGGWLSLWLLSLGADVIGYALAPATRPSLFDVAGVGRSMTSYIADVRDAQRVLDTMRDERPEIVFHLAAQPLVRRSPTIRSRGTSERRQRPRRRLGAHDDGVPRPGSITPADSEPDAPSTAWSRDRVGRLGWRPFGWRIPTSPDPAHGSSGGAACPTEAPSPNARRTTT